MLAWRDLGGIQLLCVDGAGHRYARHAHGELVIGATLIGQEEALLDGRAFSAGPGEITLTNPWQVQEGGSASPRWRYISIYLDRDALPHYWGLSENFRFRRTLLRDPAIHRRLAHAGALAGSPLATNDEATERLIAALSPVLDAGGDALEHRDAGPDRLARHIAETLIEAIAEPPSLSDLACRNGVTPAHIIRLFTRAYGMPPHGWLFQRRLAEARRRIPRGEPLKNIAADLGFADQAHLTRRFKAAFGISPGRWAASEITFKPPAAASASDQLVH